MSLLSDCKRWNATLSGFVVMTHHFHLVVKPEDSKTITHLMNEIKSNAFERLSSQLLPYEKGQMKMQAGLGRNQFWKRSFRANPLYTSEVFQQKLHYLHENPVRAGLAEAPEDYFWSSSHIFQQGLCDHYGLIDIPAALEYYQKMRDE